jgi:xanthine dehydrogenase accessory factor
MTVWIRGAGELASATAHCLHGIGFQVVLSDLAVPLAIRRTVSFSEAMIHGTADVEGTQAVRCEFNDVLEVRSQNRIALIEDDLGHISALHPAVMVDARMLKRFEASLLPLAPITVGLGPGFHAGRDCHAVIETRRGHDLGRIIWEGSAQANTGVPGEVGGERSRRIIRAPQGGSIEWVVDIGDLVTEGALMGIQAGKHEIRAHLNGLVRGLISTRVHASPGLKIADIDPRGRKIDHHSISDKARSVGRGAMEAIFIMLNRNSSDG